MALATPQQLWREQHRAIYITQALHKDLKLQAVREGRDLKELTEAAVRAYLLSQGVELADETSEVSA